MSKVTVIPPQRVPAQLPTANTGGYVESRVTKWRADYTTKALESIARVNEAQAKVISARTSVASAVIRAREVEEQLADLPARFAHERHLTNIRRQDEVREVEHHYTVNEHRRRTSEAQAEAAYINADTERVDARQRNEAQRKHGGLAYELIHAEQNLKRLDIQLSERERRALMRKQLRDIEGSDDDTHRRRAERIADGDDTDIEEDIDEIFGRSK